MKTVNYIVGVISVYAYIVKKTLDDGWWNIFHGNIINYNKLLYWKLKRINIKNSMHWIKIHLFKQTDQMYQRFYFFVIII